MHNQWESIIGSQPTVWSFLGARRLEKHKATDNMYILHTQGLGHTDHTTHLASHVYCPLKVLKIH